MDTGQIVLKTGSKIALAALGILFAISLVHFKEKVFFADASYILFNIINYHHLDIQFNRYGSFISQLVPLIGGKLHLPLLPILIAYAVSFSLFYFVVASLLVYRYRRYGLAILAALFYCLFVSDSFYWISEIPQGIAWLFLWLGITLYLGNKKTNILLVAAPFLIFSFLTIFTHFVIIIPAVFLWVYLILEHKNWPFSKKNTLFLTSLFAGMLALKMGIAVFGHQAAGEDIHLHGVTHVSFKDIFNSFSTPVVGMFVYRCFRIYWIGMVVLLLGITSLIVARQWRLAVWVLISLLGYIIIMGLTYTNDVPDTLLFHIESEWICIGIIVAAPFAFAFLPSMKPTIRIGALIFVFSVRLYYIERSASVFTWRTHFQERILSTMKSKGVTKLALYRDTTVKAKYMLDWATGYESLLMSAMDGDIPNRSFIFIDDENNKQIVEKISKKAYTYLWDVKDADDFNKKYFIVDTSNAYQIMTYEDFMK